MKRMIVCLAILSAFAMGTLISRAAGDSPTPAAAGEPSATQALPGQDVRVYFRQEAMPGRPIEWRRGVVKQADDRFITLLLNGGETLWIPVASVAYLESSKAATTRPN